MKEELDRQIRQRTAELEHSNALMIAEVLERKKWQQDSELLIQELQHATNHLDAQRKKKRKIAAAKLSPEKHQFLLSRRFFS